jgi:hypothetical protein
MNADINPDNGDTQKVSETLILNVSLMNLTLSEIFIVTFEQPLTNLCNETELF